MKTIIFPVTDLEAAKKVFRTLLGVDPSVEAPYYVGFDAAGQHVGLDPNGHARGMAGPVDYWEVDDINETVRRLEDAGARLRQAPTDVGGGKLIATVTDGDGNMIGLAQSPDAG